jgi:uncharacterized protein (TIGR03437 family)
MPIRGAAWLLLFAGAMTGQTFDNQTLTGKYYFRHLLFTTGTSENITDIRSLWGAIQFDGGGNYTFNGQSAVGVTPPVALTGSGTYSVGAAGIVTLTNPQSSTLTLNARYGVVAANEAMLIGSSTEAAANTFDLFIAMQAAAGTSNASVTGSYGVATLAFPSGMASLVRSALFNLQASAPGAFASISVNGHAANLLSGQPTSQTVTGATYAMQADGSGTATIPFAAGADATTQLVSGTKAIYVSAGGDVILGGASDGSAQDIFVGFKEGAGIAWNNVRFWQAGLRYESPGDASAYSGSLFAGSSGTLTLTRREHQLQPSGAVTYDFTGANSYTLSSDGSGTAELTSFAAGAAGNGFAETEDNASDPAGYEVSLGVLMPTITGTGVFLSPQGIANGASFAPAGDPIAPGEFVSLFGTGLSAGTKTAAPPYPPGLSNVTVLINGVQAPLSLVSSLQINALVPYATTGPTATIVVVNSNGAMSNTVTVPVAATAPGVFSLTSNGIGNGAILHADYTLVTTAKPAVTGETVLVFLTGLGAVTPPVPDGKAGSGTTLNYVNAPVTALIGGLPAAVSFAGLAPGYPGLYQLNVVVPLDLNVTATGPFPLAIQTPESFHDQVNVIVGP